MESLTHLNGVHFYKNKKVHENNKIRRLLSLLKKIEQLFQRDIKSKICH